MAKKKHKHQPGRLNSFTACISTAMVLILVGIIIFLGLMVDSLERTIKEEFTVEVLLEDSLKQDETQKLLTEIEAMPYAKKVTFISKEEATRTMAENHGVNPAEFIGESPFPASFEVMLNADYTEPDSLEHFMPKLKQASGVTDVIYPGDLMKDVNANIQHVTLVLFIIILLLGVVSVSLINNTMRLNIAQRRHSIQTMKLVGASWGFIRRPFLLQAAGMGAVAGLLADGVLLGFFTTLLRWDPENAQIITTNVIGITLFCVAVVGVILTLLCAYFSVNRHLAMTRDEAALY